MFTELIREFLWQESGQIVLVFYPNPETVKRTDFVNSLLREPRQKRRGL